MDLRTATIPRGALCVLSFLCLSAAAALAATPPIERMELSTVRIFVKQGDSYATGSGFIVGDGSYVVTNHHVIDHADGIAVLAKQLKIPATRIVADDPAKDLAILRLKENSGRPPVTLSLRAGVKKTQTIIAAGFPGAADDGPTDDDSLLEVKFSKGIISAFVRSKSGTLLYQIDASINPGNSGGPLFDECGRVVGVDAMKSLIPAVVVGADGKPTPERVPYGEGVAWAIQADELLDLLQTAGISPRASATACGESVSAPPPGPKKRTDRAPQPQTRPDHSGEKGQPKEAVTARNLLIPALVAIALLSLIVALVGQRRSGRPKTVAERPANLPVAPGPTVPYQSPTPSPARDLRLRGVSGAHAGKEFLVSLEPITLGRDPHLSQIVFDAGDSVVSKRHCVIRLDPSSGGLVVEDCGSTNGTFLESGERLRRGEPRLVQPHGSFYLGDRGHIFQVRGR